jgi:hypothetical protein
MHEDTLQQRMHRRLMPFSSACRLEGCQQSDACVQVSIATVVTAEQIASFLSKGNTTAGYDVSKAFLQYLTANAAGQVMAKLHDKQWVSTAVSAAAQTSGQPAPEEGKLPAVADAVTLVNKRLSDIRGPQFDGDSEKLLIAWAKTAHVADVAFAEHAAKFGDGSMAEPAFRCSSQP